MYRSGLPGNWGADELEEYHAPALNLAKRSKAITGVSSARNETPLDLGRDSPGRLKKTALRLKGYESQFRVVCLRYISKLMRFKNS